MVARLPMFLFFLLLSSSQQLSAASTYPLPDDALQAAAERMAAKDYQGARDRAAKGTPDPLRSFLLGVSSYRLAQWSEAVTQLEPVPAAFTLLADYALWYRADALFHLQQFDSAYQVAERLIKDFPSSPLIRNASFLQAESLFGKGDFSQALSRYQKFIELYSSGADTVAALFQSAVCREELGDKAKAVADYRSIWLSYPGDTIAVKAEDRLQRLRGSGTPVKLYTDEELYKRGLILYDLGKYERAIDTFSNIPAKANEKIPVKITFKTGQALFKARRFHEAEQTFERLLSGPDNGVSTSDILFWYARALARNNRDDDAFAFYLRAAEGKKASPIADDALYQAAILKRFQGKNAEARAILEKFLTDFPRSPLKNKVVWEIGWLSYLMQDYSRAVQIFKQHLSADDSREKMLYWLARSYEKTGDQDNARETSQKLTESYPFGFYTLRFKDGVLHTDSSKSRPYDVVAFYPLPKGHERVRALIALGMFDEARKELSLARKKAGKNESVSGFIRLYLEMGDYATPLILLGPESPHVVSPDNLAIWQVIFPQAFRLEVSRAAHAAGIKENLVYSIIRAESRFAPDVMSAAGAVGLMQIMPATAQAIATKPESGMLRLTSPDINIDLGVRHLKDLLVRYNGNEILAIAAYNAGATPVDRWKKASAGLSEDEFIENIPYAETREYVKKVLAGTEIYRFLYLQ